MRGFGSEVAVQIAAPIRHADNLYPTPEPNHATAPRFCGVALE